MITAAQLGPRNLGAEALTVDVDQTLLQARAGDATAFAALVRRHQSMVFSLALHVLRNRTTAEDLAQDVFLELYRSIGRLESAAHVVSWLRRVTSHRCIDELRRARNRMELQMEVLPERGQQTGDREFFLEGRLRDLVAELPPNARMVMVLRFQEELEPSEIADTLNMPVNTVKSHLRRSLAVLRAALSKEGAHES
jgi:RNA polymerase sigma-70 factor (ECF subfamily)